MVLQSGFRRLVKPTLKDILLVENLNVRKVNKNEAVAYKQDIISKPWGVEYLCGCNKNLEVWELYINSKASTSLHCHPDKDTLNIVLEGGVFLETIRRKEKLRAGEFRLIKAGAIHRTTNPNQNFRARVLEIESPPNKYNLIRIKDDYGRESIGYVKFHTRKTIRGIKISKCLIKESLRNYRSSYTLRIFLPRNKGVDKSISIYELTIHSMSLKDFKREMTEQFKRCKIKNFILASGSLSLYRNGKTVKLLPGSCVFDIPLHEFNWSSKFSKLLLW